MLGKGRLGLALYTLRAPRDPPYHPNTTLTSLPHLTLHSLASLPELFVFNSVKECSLFDAGDLCVVPLAGAEVALSTLATKFDIYDTTCYQVSRGPQHRTPLPCPPRTQMSYTRHACSHPTLLSGR